MILFYNYIMILRLLSLLNFKNHDSLSLNFSHHVNCFLGNNGVGKTNLLDAIYYLSFCKSFHHSNESNNIKYGENFFMLKGEFLDSDGVELEIECSLRGKQKRFKRNNKIYNRLADHIGSIPMVSITPIDSHIITGGGEDRRRFINKLLSQLDDNYLYNLIAYNKILKQRNTLLKEASHSHINESLLLTYDQSLSKYGDEIHKIRQSFIDSIIENVLIYYDFISEKNENISIAYESQLNTSSLDNILSNNRQKDQFLMHTTGGVHRDDFIFTMNSNSLKQSGSQGQQKTFLIALKLSYFNLLKNKYNKTPILLLDDIFDKLDYNRVKKIISILNKNESGQIFISDTSLERINSIITDINAESKYFMLDKRGLYEEKIQKH